MHDEYSRGLPLKNIDSEATTNCKISYAGKLNVFDWLNNTPIQIANEEIYEVRFKNTRKGYFSNTGGIRIETGDIVAVEASPGHDIGIVSLKGALVMHQLRKLKQSTSDLKTVYRKAKPNDIDKWKEAIGMEHETMIESRKIASDLKLNMKIGDVEYQGDKTKAIFYYIADERVDFRQLIKVLADRFRIRVEMRQIGARQEAGRIGGIGSCGRELCCATFVNKFVSVTTNAARYQELSLNPQKLAGQCSKLKCCLNYEIDAYMDERKDFPSTEIRLETEQGRAIHMKTDVFRGIMWYAFDNGVKTSFMPLAVERVKEIIEKNKRGEKPEAEIEKVNIAEAETLDFKNVVGQESLTRFDQKSPKKNKKKKRRKPPRRNEDK